MTSLDVGCGSRPQGDVNIDLLIKDDDPHGVDIHSIPNFIVADANFLPFQNKKFSKVTCIHVMEHVLDEQQIYEELSRVANGIIEIRVPFELWEKFMKVIFFWKKDMIQWGKNHHKRKYTKRKLIDLLKRLFSNKKIYVYYGYASFLTSLRFAFSLILKSSTRKVPRGKIFVPFPFPFELVAVITD